MGPKPTRDYEKPRLQRFGDVAELTRNVNTGSGGDNAVGTTKKTEP